MASEIVCYHCGTANPATEQFCENCGGELKVVPSPAPLPAAFVLKQRYRVRQKLGEGGFGAVYKVEDTQLHNRFLAAKKLDLSSIAPKDQQDAINSFQREAALLAGLQHPNLPRVYEHFIENGDYYLIMDFIEGETLTEQLARQSLQLLPIERVVSIGIELATVLDYLHTRQPPIIFRDLKPDNIMLTADNHIYLIDFGIARHFDPYEKKHTENLGTPGYVSPEHYKLVTPLSDVYSLGAILHQLLLGEDPSTYGLFQYPELHLLGHAQTQLANLVMQMLALDQRSRPASAAEVRQRLQQILQELQQQAPAAAPPTRKLASASPILAHPAVKPPPRPGARGELLHIYTQHKEAVYALAWSPRGDRLASAGADREVRVWQALSGPTLFTYQQHTGGVSALAWSPNGKYLASAGNDHTVQVWQADSGKGFSAYREHKRRVGALSWSPGAQLIASGDASGTIVLWSPRNGQCQQTYQRHRAPITALAYSPDGHYLASADEEGAVHVWECAGGSLCASYTGHTSAVSTLAWSPDSSLIVSSSEDRKDHALHLWRAVDGQSVAMYHGHQRMVNALSWSSASGLLASAGREQSALIWDPRTRQQLFTYRGHTAPVNALSWSPDGHCLASADEEGAIHVWWAS